MRGTRGRRQSGFAWAASGGSRADTSTQMRAAVCLCAVRICVLASAQAREARRREPVRQQCFCEDS